MLHFEGDRELSLPPADAFAKLTDARFLVKCIPDIEAVKDVEADHAHLVLRPGFSFVRGTLDVSLRVADLAFPKTARVQLVSKGIGSSSTVEATLTFIPQGEATLVHWSVQVKDLAGLLKMVPAGLISGAAQKVISDVWASIERNLPANHPA